MNKGTYQPNVKTFPLAMINLFLVSDTVLFFSREGWLPFEDLFQTANADYQVGLT